MALILCPMCLHRRDFTLEWITKGLTRTRGPLVDDRRSVVTEVLDRSRDPDASRVRDSGTISRENPMSIHRSSRWHPDRARVACLVCHVKRPFFFRNAGTLLGTSLTGSPPPSNSRGTRTLKDWTRTRHSTGDTFLNTLGWKFIYLYSRRLVPLPLSRDSWNLHLGPAPQI